MNKRSCRNAPSITATIVCAVIAQPSIGAIDLGRKAKFDIPAQQLGTALIQFSRQAHVQVVADGQLLDNAKSAAVVGYVAKDMALSGLLKNTAFGFKSIGSTVYITNDEFSAISSHMLEDAGAIPIGEAVESRPIDSTDTGSESNYSDATAASEELAQILVTAEKRTERLQEVPAPVTVINTDALAASAQTRIQDFYTTVPSLNVVSTGINNTLTMRGVTTGTGVNPTVGVLIDDVPFGASTGLGTRTNAPDIDPAILSQIEALRGPQGTLYGASGIGGILKYETLEPSTKEASARIQADTNAVYNGAEPGYGVRVSSNVPISDTIALRLSGFTRQDPGYIDDPTFHLAGVNKANSYGGFASALWQPSADWSLKLNGLLQRTTGEGQPYSTFGLRTLQQSYTFSGVGAYHHSVSLYSITLKGNLGFADLTSITSYGADTLDAISDQTLAYGGDASANLYGVTSAEGINKNRTYKVTQELRLSGSVNRRLNWLAGIFYTHEDSATRDLYLAVDPADSTSVGILFNDPYPSTYKEYAAFTDLTFVLTDQLDIQVGGRESQNRQTYEEIISGPEWESFGFPFTTTIPPVRTRDNSFTYLLTPRFRISPDLMTYIRLASGYRPGGPNPTCTLFSVPCQYKPDKTNNYEIGVKGAIVDNRVTFDASVYYIDWKDIQLQIVDPQTFAVYSTNGSRARSQGVELSLMTRPIEGLSINGWVALNDAELRKDLPPGPSNPYGVAGDRLPYGSRFSGNVSITDEIPISGEIIGVIGGDVSYLGNRLGNFQSGSGTARAVLPAYAQTNVHVGVHRSSDWSANLYVDNVADKRGVLLYNNSFPQSTTYIRPRTVGLSVWAAIK